MFMQPASDSRDAVTIGSRYRVPEPTETDVTSVAGEWSIACVKGREEKAVSGRLRSAGVATYLPIVTVTQRRIRRINGVPRVRRERVERAAFPNYLFVACAGIAERSALFDARDVFQVIPVSNQRRLIAELSQIQRALQVDSELRVTDWIAKGVKAVVTSGAFVGMTGEVSERRGCRVFLIQVSGLSGAIELEVDDHEIERAEVAA